MNRGSPTYTCKYVHKYIVDYVYPHAPVLVLKNGTKIKERFINLQIKPLTMIFFLFYDLRITIW